MSNYLTDGINLYEIASQRTAENAGCFWRSGGRYGPMFTYTILRDCVSEATARVDDLTLMALSEVDPEMKPEMKEAA